MQNNPTAPQPDQNNQPSVTPEQAAPQQEVKPEQANPVSQVGGILQNLAQNATQTIQESAKNVVNQAQNVGQEAAQVAAQTVAQPQANMPAVTQDEKIYSLIAYIPLVAFLSLILKPESNFVRLHARQGLLVFVIFFFSGIFAAILSTFGLIGGILAFFVALLPLAMMILGVYSMYMAVTGVWWKIPLLGDLAQMIPVEIFAKVTKEAIVDPLMQAKEGYDSRKTVEKSDDQQTPKQN